MARRYEFYFRVVKTIFYERGQRVKCFFLPLASCCVIFFLLYGQECFYRNNSVKAGKDVIDILTSEHMENTPKNRLNRPKHGLFNLIKERNTVLTI